DFQLGSLSGFDVLKVTGTVTLQPTAQANFSITLPGSFNAPAAQAFTVLDNDGGDAIVNTFTVNGVVTSNGSSITISGKPFRISYDGGDGNGLVVVYTPAVSQVYADDDWAALAPDTAIVDVDPVSPGNQPGIVGYNAFGTIAGAFAAIPASGIVLVNGGTY